MRLQRRFPWLISLAYWLPPPLLLSLSFSCGGAFARLPVWSWALLALVLFVLDDRFWGGLLLPLFFLKGGLYVPIEDIVVCYVNIVQVALPIALVFGLGDLCVGTILRAAFGGRLIFRA